MPHLAAKAGLLPINGLLSTDVGSHGREVGLSDKWIRPSHSIC